ncbi:Xylose isomerase domain protein TIM barrel [Kribbella flavida DSM 17836]|uniref:Xylose isomerase domain protein TIM barrel n=1 Tax=Kribbella flavida (strain DSM 17836 / JCM 10339 / NBRC 14399) TaxID=479435 RepID=D2PQH6_KRIFD|nr:sugar phosphate isomerase/epimerase [Kribbella flavida]ADB29163.1 Xylose isomerase domain protein TIM barrel [Kribbella flavida DSM 17836]
MTLGFSTLGCAGEPLDAVLDLARRHDIAGLELRAADDEFTHVGLTASERRDLRQRIEHAGLEILAINSYVHLCGVEEQPLDAHLELAADLGARGVRVFLRDDQSAARPDGPTPGEFRAMDRVARAPKDVSVLLETHDTHSSGQAIAAFCRLLDAEVPGHSARGIWDAAHTWRTGESPAESLDLLRPWLEFVQIKDSDSRQDFKPVPIGTGDYPIDRLLQALGDSDYPLSLEWERKWHPHLPPLSEALAATRTWLTTAQQ